MNRETKEEIKRQLEEFWKRGYRKGVEDVCDNTKVAEILKYGYAVDWYIENSKNIWKIKDYDRLREAYKKYVTEHKN